MFKNTQEFKAPDGTVIFARHWRPTKAKTTPPAVVQIFHGLAEHSERYEHFAEQLVADGYHVFAHDHRGHGYTAKNKSELGLFDSNYGWRLVIEDGKHINDFIREQYIGIPIITFGHSMGSFILQKCLTKYPKMTNGVILSGTTVPNKLLVKSALTVANLDKARSGALTRCQIVEYLTFKPYNKAFKPNRTDSDWLSRDNAAVDAYVADIRCGFVSCAQLWIDLSKGILELFDSKIHSKLPKNVPYLILGGDHDPLSNKGKGSKKLEKLLKSYKISSVDLKLYADGRHEMLNEINRDEVEKDICYWIRNTVSKLAGASKSKKAA